MCHYYLINNISILKAAKIIIINSNKIYHCIYGYIYYTACTLETYKYAVDSLL